MEHIDFEYTVSPRQHSTSPLTAELTYTELRRIRNHYLSAGETTLLLCPNQRIVQHSACIPLNEPKEVVVFGIARSANGQTTVISRPSKNTTTNHYSLNCARISEFLSRFGVKEYSCSSILRDIDTSIISSPSTSSSSRGRGVIEVKIKKIKTMVLNFRTLSTVILSEWYCSDSTSEEKEQKNGCVICMEDYAQGSLVAKLHCKHDFHGFCIYKWTRSKRQCPLCRCSLLN